MELSGFQPPMAVSRQPLRRDTELTANADCSEPAALDQSTHRPRTDRPSGGQSVDGPVRALNPFAISLRSAGMAAGDC